MKKSEIRLVVELDDNNVPEKIHWSADDSQVEGMQQTKAISLSLWDHRTKNTMRIDLWGKDMPVDEMKRFFVDCLGGIAQTALSSTGDDKMAGKINALCEELVEDIKAEE